MSAKDNACRKFQANIFNKNKCQNCFKARDAHLLSDEDFTQAKPIYGGWLLLAPEGTNFDNPLHRSRKWQRRFFLLYEHGLLRYALDDMASTLPQGTINLNQCVDVVDGESRTGQKHSLCICTPDKDHYIRAESKEIIHGWQEALMVFLRTNKQNQKKKRKVETPTPQVHVYTDPPTREVLKEQFHPQINHLHVLALDSPPSSDATLCPLPSPDRLSSPNSHANVLPSSLSSSQSSLDSEQSPESRVGRAGRGGQGYAALADVPRARRLSHRDAYRSSQKRQELRARTRSPGREEVERLFGRERSTVFFFVNVGSLLISSIIFQPDLLNFKKGWMTKLYEDGLWKKHWFVLTDQSLRFYRDSIAEEAADVDGEVDLSTCYDVTEFPVQRNYGFQILSKEGLFTLSAMTSGIRRNWIQAILKNMRPTVAPDPPSNSSQLSNSSVVEENKSGQPSIKRLPHKVPQEQVRMDVDHARDAQEVDSKSTARRNSDVQVEIEQRWHQVETTPLREEKQVPITGSSNVPVGERAELTPALEKEVISDHYIISDLFAQRDLARLQQQNSILQEQLQDAHGREQSAREGYVLQDKLTAAMADIVASEQAVARMRSELKIERVRCQEREEEWVRNETTLRSQLRDSEERLRQVEASLLEKNQELRQLEQKQALQRDQHNEVQRLQERLAEATGRLISMEEAQNMREERERKEQRSLEEKHERERQGLTRRLVESEERRHEIEEQLQEAQEQVEALLRGSGGMETVELREEVRRLQQELEAQADMVEMLRESVRSLEEERDQLTCRCQELLNQIAEADREVGKQQACLTMVETDYHSLESSYERVSEEFARISHVLREKEEEVKQTKEMYEQLIRQKEQDLSEALIKMAALGSSLEETELCLQQKQEILSKMERDYPGMVESRKAEQQLQAKLVVAEDRIAELEEHLNALRLGYADLRMRRYCSQEDLLDGLKEMQHDVSSSSSTSQLLLARSSSETEMSLVQRQRIRFSTIQCQSYHRSQGADKFQTENTSLDLTQDLSLDHMHDLSLTQDIGVVSDRSFQQCRDPEKFISIIHALETKLLSTEEKLRNLTEKIRDQPDLSLMQEHLSTRSTIEDYTNKTCDELPMDEPSQKFLKTFGEQDSEEYERALALVESCTERVREILSNQKETSSDESLICTLAEVEKRLVCATMYLRKGSTLYESCQIFDAPDVHLMQEGIMRFARTLTFEAEILEKMGFSLQDLNSDIMLALNSIHKDAENIKKNCNGCLSVVYADVLTRKLMLETMFLAEVDKLEMSKLSNNAFSQDVIKNVCISAELAYSLQNLTMNFQEKFDELQKDLLQVNETLKQRDMALTDAVSASKRAHIESMTQSGSDHLGDIAPPELVPYMEQIEIEEAQSLAAEIVRRHLAGGMLSHSAESESHLQMSWENLIAELKKQAKALRSLSQEIERICEEGETNSLSGLADAIQMSLWHDDSSAACMREALMQAQVAYVACRLRAGHTRELSLCQETSRNMAALVQEHAESVAAIQRHYQSCLEKEHLSFTGTISSLQEENDMLRGELSYKLRELQEQQQNLTQLEEAFHREKDELKSRHADEMGRAEQEQITRELELMERAANSQRRLETLLLGMEDAELRHKEQIRKLEQEFQSKVQELEHANREDLRKLQECYSQTICSLEERSEQVENACPMEEGDGTDQVTCRESLLRIRELEMQLSSMREELEQKPLDGDLTSLKEKYQRDLESLKATCERGFAAMEETHQKVIEDIQRQHQREIRKLLEEKERLLEEETNATIAAIEAMKNAHREELEKSQRSQMSGVSADIQELRRQYEEELQSIHRELEVLSEQYSQKCLENAHLAQALEAERQALGQCQRENQKLHIHNQELNHRLNEEITRMHSCISEDKSTSSLTQGKDIYELEVLLRVKESEIQYLKQEINSLKDELQSALRDKKYASDKYKDIYTELSIVKAKADCDINKLREKLLAATEALGELDAEGSGVTAGYDIMKSKSNPDFLKKEKSKQIRGVRSKSLKEGLTVQERMKLFETKDSRKI
uniref:Centrosome-associated protein CEP250-like n=1 Tax=Sinocyclocheilus anshuiensis TaxID=1608454 RepID=A0A671RB29_9TELE